MKKRMPRAVKKPDSGEDLGLEIESEGQVSPLEEDYFWSGPPALSDHRHRRFGRRFGS